ncbi:hypothetical protein K2224_19305 [Streptomyces sp. BHT-5-2]|uniref:DUF7144 family membrane protein n=1 Tax=unclassified Streptomyces TaxID=2593676 RepID=UPI001C8DF5CD|nr:hypothetical protein [Streptomyces sp. BHT-5-2]QZL05022.1 hypothetical protein K2224_19305 [Streptomyces sp. BHT-5-2]
MASAAGHPTGAPHPGFGGGRTAPQTADRRGHGLVMFAGVMLALLALFNGLDGIAAIVNSHIFVGNVSLVLGDLQAFGWLMVALAILQAAAAVGVLSRGSEAARWFGVAVLGLNAFAQMFFVPSYPVWSVMIIALDVLAIYGLCVYGGRGAAPTTGPAQEG